ncbi:hypothetical protein CANARDRAFT_26913 [[Candida] arabinofermentans NRRL YB-2248]|uniref:Sorbose reductase SOU1 n=1 Tax=[Candida] arabinofermentans NRRL YB-2248 TaxID=983967 RepID=A0A1E4T700_9ASCO|nr:hypothetical protein CANARDRAFT_26913 [[Candida] arabinofermentans NRRL YB-2248]
MSSVSKSSYILYDATPLPKPNPQLSDNVLDLFSLKGKVSVVTGTGLGIVKNIGYSVTEAYAQAGSDVALVDLEAPLKAASYFESTYGVRAKGYACDVTDKKAVKLLIDQIELDFGRIDVFVANAGVSIPSKKTHDQLDAHIDYDDDEVIWDETIDINLRGVFYCCKFVGQVFKKNGNKGSIIITASMSGHIVNVPMNQTAYNTSKAAVKHLAKSLSIEFIDYARVNSISPGYIDSGLNDKLPTEIRARWWSLVPMGREGMTKELVGAYLYFASDASTYTTGADLIIDGAFTVV